METASEDRVPAFLLYFSAVSRACSLDDRVARMLKARRDVDGNSSHRDRQYRTATMDARTKRRGADGTQNNTPERNDDEAVGRTPYWMKRFRVLDIEQVPMSVVEKPKNGCLECNQSGTNREGSRSAFWT